MCVCSFFTHTHTQIFGTGSLVWLSLSLFGAAAAYRCAGCAAADSAGSALSLIPPFHLLLSCNSLSLSLVGRISPPLPRLFLWPPARARHRSSSSPSFPLAMYSFPLYSSGTFTIFPLRSLARALKHSPPAAAGASLNLTPFAPDENNQTHWDRLSFFFLLSLYSSGRERKRVSGGSWMRVIKIEKGSRVRKKCGFIRVTLTSPSTFTQRVYKSGQESSLNVYIVRLRIYTHIYIYRRPCLSTNLQSQTVDKMYMPRCYYCCSAYL